MWVSGGIGRGDRGRKKPGQVHMRPPRWLRWVEVPQLNEHANFPLSVVFAGGASAENASSERPERS